MATAFSAVKETQNSGKQKQFLPCIIILFILTLFPFISPAQRWEVGGALGGGNYIGDVSPSFRFENYRPAGGIFGRFNFSHAVSAKLGINCIQAKGSTKYYDNPFFERNYGNFIRVAGEVAGQIEYNFFNYRDTKSRRRWTPYYFIGIGGAYLFNSKSREELGPLTKVIIPTGVGFRYLVGGKWNLGLEIGGRKMFSDSYDRREEPETMSQDNKFSNVGYKADKDWYFFTALSVSYTFYTIPCPFDYFK